LILICIIIDVTICNVVKKFDIVIFLRTKQVMTSKTKLKSVRQLCVLQLHVLLVDSAEWGLFIHSFIHYYADAEAAQHKIQ